MEQIEKLNWKEACELLGCGRNCFYSLIKKGFLPAYRISGKKRGLWVYKKDCLALRHRINTCLTE